MLTNFVQKVWNTKEIKFVIPYLETEYNFRGLIKFKITFTPLYLNGVVFLYNTSQKVVFIFHALAHDKEQLTKEVISQPIFCI